MTCSGCAEGKTHAAPHQRKKEHNYKPGEILSIDTVGPFPISHNRNSTLLTILDAYSRYCISVSDANRSSTKKHIIATITDCVHIHGKPPRILLSDNAKELAGLTIQNECAKIGTHLVTITPYQPQENSLNERVHRTILDAARAGLAHSSLPSSYWDHAVADATYKYNCIPHSTTQQIPMVAWTGQDNILQRFLIFGQFSTIPIHGSKSKLHARSEPCQYLHPTSNTHAQVINLRNNKTQSIRLLDFHIYNPSSDPVNIIRYPQAFKLKLQDYHRPIPKDITNYTPAPANPHQARKYPDQQEWAIAHDQELDQLDDQDVAEWLYDENTLPKDAVKLPLTIHYRYKRNASGDIIERKARCAARGDKMVPHLHYEPDQVSTYMTDKTTIRFLMALSAQNTYH